MLHSPTIDGSFCGFNGGNVTIEITYESDDERDCNEHNVMETSNASALFQDDKNSEYE